MVNRYRQKIIIGITLLIVGCLIVSSVFVYFYFFWEEKPAEGTIGIVPDERISPLTTQAVFFEINRIRRKGIIEHMENSGSQILNKLPIRNIKILKILDGLRPGLGWREKPLFSYIVTFDDYIWISPIDYNTWDTDYMNQEIFRKVEEEQTQVEIKFTFVEKEKKLIRTIEKEISSFNVVYDFKTGTWKGDDSFDDIDGYGHYNDSNFEMWFTIRQTDYDGDGIPYWTEVNILGTDPKKDDSKLDPDKDGIPTMWEWKWGYNPFSKDDHEHLDPDNDGLQNVEEWIMAKWSANPFFPEIYIETDYMERAPFRPIEITIDKGRILPITRPRITQSRLDGWDHIFWEESQQMLIERFNQHGITVHIDDGVMNGGGEMLPFVSGKGAYSQETGLISEFYKNNFADERKGIFRYVVIGHGGGWAHPQDYRHYYDTMCVPSNKIFFRNQLSFALSPRAKRIGRAVQVMHELGHTCGLRHGEWPGVDNLTYGGTTWKDYRSCMNYYHFALRFFDYSDGSRGENDRNDWKALDLAYFQRPAEDMEGLE